VIFAPAFGTRLRACLEQSNWTLVPEPVPLPPRSDLGGTASRATGLQRRSRNGVGISSGQQTQQTDRGQQIRGIRGKPTQPTPRCIGTRIRALAGRPSGVPDTIRAPSKSYAAHDRPTGSRGSSTSLVGSLSGPGATLEVCSSSGARVLHEVATCRGTWRDTRNIVPPAGVGYRVAAVVEHLPGNRRRHLARSTDRGVLTDAVVPGDHRLVSRPRLAERAVASSSAGTRRSGIEKHRSRSRT
jgi:hypothetical protein